jgi:topoisomerase-4 subunit A
MIYRDGKSGPSYIKRFVSGVTKDKLYDLTSGTKGSQIIFYLKSNGEAEVITVILRQVGSIKKLKFDIDFAKLAIKGSFKGNLASKYPIKKIEIKEKVYLLCYKSGYDETSTTLKCG